MGTFSADPTKEFFIDMLTRDIPLEWAILDLIDNCVDGARDKIFKEGKNLIDAKAYEGYHIKIIMNENEFVIHDNCGGFSKHAAENYAFRFGRPKLIKAEDKFPKGSVGRFGVGMKRGIFKLGSYFVVETKKEKDHFIVEEDIEEWNSPDVAWEFRFIDIKPGKIYPNTKPILKTDGTYIKVKKLKDAVKQDLKNPQFHKRLMTEIQRILSYSIQRGLKIFVNDMELEARPIQLLVSDNLIPYYFENTINEVSIKIYAGIGEPEPKEAGWYIFCNDRLMVEKDKSNITGWEGTEDYYGDTGVQKFHNKVAMFRGLVFFNSDDSSLLPMTTTKTGIDINSLIYKTTRSNMINAMNVVLSRLNKLENNDQRQSIVNNSKKVDIIKFDQSKLSKNFIFPDPKANVVDDNQIRISYKVDKDLLSLVKQSIKITNKDLAGLATFDYYVKMKELDL